jgi:hypothetical protein
MLVRGGESPVRAKLLLLPGAVAFLVPGCAVPAAQPPASQRIVCADGETDGASCSNVPALVQAPDGRVCKSWKYSSVPTPLANGCSAQKIGWLANGDPLFTVTCCQ